MLQIYDKQGQKQSLDSLLISTDAVIWMTSVSNEIGRLAQGN